jgi:glycine/D-amino acid oxidase-like deaminating enzyme
MIREIPILATVDVAVVGAGSAGSTAAIAAARTGASVLLLDRLPFLGGTSTAVLDTFYGFYTPGSVSRKVVGGVADDVVATLRTLGPVLERPNTYGAGTGVTYLAEHLKVAWELLVTRSGARPLLHAMLQDVDVLDGRVRSLVIATRAGLARVVARAYVDASGDADLCAFAGFGFEQAGSIDPAQTLTTTFRMANVDIERRKALSKAEFHALMEAAAASGDYDLPRREGSDHITPVEGMIATVMTRLDPNRRDPDGRLVDATDPWFLTEAEMAGRRQALEYVRFLVDRVPGYERAALVALGTQIGVRETRRVYGDYRLTRDDVLAARRFDDGIGLCGAPIEDHHGGTDTVWQYLPDGEAVDIPYRALVVRDAANVLVAGRCFSATHDAHASVRSMAQCMAMGQAAGTAAAMAVDAGTDPRDLDVGALRDRLRRDGAILDLADAPTDAAAGTSTAAPTAGRAAARSPARPPARTPTT